MNGDHSVSNNISFDGASTGTWVAGADNANDSILANTSQGTLSYLGTVDYGGRTSPTITGRPRGTLFLGDITNISGNLLYTQSATGYFSFLSTSANGGVAKTYAVGTTSIGGSTTTGGILVIDSNNSLGASGNITLAASTLQLQPGTASVVLPSTRAVSLTSTATSVFNTPSGSTLTVQGEIAGATTGGVLKTGLGTLILQASSTIGSGAGALSISAGTLRLDGATAAATVWNPATASTLTLGTASGTFGSGGTLEITGTAAQAFGAVTVNARANTINLTGAMTLTLGAITRTTGSTLNFSVPTGTVASSHVAINGLVNGGTTWNGNDWAAANGSNISQYTSYTALTGTASAPTITSTAAANYIISSSTTNNITLAATGTVNTNTIKYSDSTARTIDVRNGTTQGTLRFGAGVAGGGVTSVGGVLVATGAGALTIGIAGTPGTITAGGTTTNTLGDLVFINNSTSNITVNSVIANNGGTTGNSPVVYDGRSTGKLILAGANTFTGSITINKGVLEVATVNNAAVAGTLGQSTAGAGNILLNGGTFRANLSGNGATDHGFTVNAPSTIEVVANSLTINSTLLGVASANAQIGVLNAGILKKTGAGTLELKDLATNANNANLSIEVVEGVLLLNKVTSSTISAVDLAGGAALIIDSSAAGDAPRVVISGTGGNQISDVSSVVVKGDDTVKGVLDLNGFNETIDGLAGSGIVTTGVAGTSTLTVGGNNSAGLSAYTLAAAAAGVNATGLNHFFGTISDGLGTLALTKTGSGTQILSAVQNYSGATIISAGTLQLGIANALPNGSGKGNVTIVGNNGGVAVGGSGLVLAPGTLDMGGFDQILNGLNSTTGGFVTNNPTLGWNGSAWGGSASTNNLTVGSNDASASFDGVIQDGFTVAPGITATGYVGTINLIKTGTGIQTLKGANTYGGSTAIQDGTVIITGSNNRLPTGTTVILGSGSNSGLLQLGDGAGALSQTIAGLSTSGSGTANAVVGGNASHSTLFLNQTGTSTYSGALGGAGANQNNLNFTLQGGGTLTLNGLMTLSGTTTVRQGSTLVLDSDLLNSAVTLGGSIGGTLISNNTLGGLVTVNSGGVLAPGNTAASDVASLTLQSGLTLNNGGTLALQLGSTGGSAPRVGDLILLTGGLFTINGGEISLTELVGGNGVLLGTYDLIDYSGATGFTGFSNLSLASSVIGTSNYFVVLQDTGTKIQVLVDNARFWSGATDGQWSTTVANWSPANFFVNGAKVMFQDSYPTNAGEFNV
ncbi:MAG: autotransporter-associated beta strand repeat-containing protein, partial [Gammaproteobacteria bacterium]|nr:autotransporter-associated beta strand repeat-containing protein [Gammaproteobacteria bacterium]